MQSKKIMIVDDDKDFLMELHSALVLEGFEVVAIDDSTTVLRSAQDINPDIILLDIKMKGLYGFQIAERLKGSAKTANIPILGMSGYFTRKEDAMLMDLCGMKMCFKKPINPDHLIKKIDMVLNEKTNQVKRAGEFFK
ncbi:MAG: response regulator [bacterium]